jgi:hypothetical protein
MGESGGGLLTGERDCGRSSGVPTAEMGGARVTRRTVGDWGLGDEGYWSSGDTECSKRLGDKGEGWMGVRGKDKALISMMGQGRGRQGHRMDKGGREGLGGLW